MNRLLLPLTAFRNRGVAGRASNLRWPRSTPDALGIGGNNDLALSPRSAIVGVVSLAIQQREFGLRVPFRSESAMLACEMREVQGLRNCADILPIWLTDWATPLDGCGGETPLLAIRSRSAD